LARSSARAKGAIFGLETAAIAVGVLLMLLQTKINPALLVLGAAVVGLLSFDRICCAARVRKWHKADITPMSDPMSAFG
jgi:hypothetical protein